MSWTDEKIEQLKELWDQGLSAGVLDVVSYGMLLDAHKALGDWRGATALLREMQASASRFGGVRPDAVCYSTVVAACAPVRRVSARSKNAVAPVAKYASDSALPPCGVR